MKTNVEDFLSSLEGGVFHEALSSILSDVAMHVRNNDGKAKGKIKLELSFEKFGDQQVMVTHKMDFKKPTNKGSITEDRVSQTPMFVNKGGELTLFQKDQDDMFAPNVVGIGKQKQN